MADISIAVSGSVSGSIVVGNHNVIIQSNGTEVDERTEPPPRPTPRRHLIGMPLPRGGPPPIGRDGELRQIEDWLDEDLPVEVIGSQGMGKSLLLRTLASRRSQAGAEVVCLSAAGLSVEDIVQEIFHACYDSEDYKPDPDRLRRLMGRIQALIIVDDVVASPKDIAVLLDAVPSSSLIISSTERCLWGDGRRVELAGLPADPGLALVERELDRSLDDTERTLVEAFWRDVAGHPLALIQAARALRTAAAASVPPDRQALADALVSGLGEQAHITLSLILAVNPAEIPSALIEELTGAAEALAGLERAGLVLEGASGYCAALPMAALVAESFGHTPDAAEYTRPLASWAAGASPQQLGNAAPIIITVLRAAIDQHAYGPARDLARTAAPALCRTLRWGSWQQVLTLGKEAAHALGASDDEAYFDHEENARLKALGKGVLIGAVVGVGFLAGQHAAAPAATAKAVALKGTASGIKGFVLSPITGIVAAATAVAGLIGAVSYANSGYPSPAPQSSPSPSIASPSITTSSTTPTVQPISDPTGGYTLAMTTISCQGFEDCNKTPGSTPIRIECAAQNCSIIGTDGWMEHHDLIFDGTTLKTEGPDGLFNYCVNERRPGHITITLIVASWQQGQNNSRTPSELRGRITTSSPAYKNCAAGEAVYAVSSLPGSTPTQEPSPTASPRPTQSEPTPAPAQANSPCQTSPSRATCDKVDPTASNCDQDAVIVQGGQATGPLHGTEFTVELLWSPTCHANWSRAQPTTDRSVEFGPWIEPGRGDATRFFAKVNVHGGWTNSPMAYSDSTSPAAKACAIVPAYSGDKRPYWLCTPMLSPDGRPM
jgi:hypothetical protein